MIKQGSVWVSPDRQEFMVIDVVETNGHRWVHYREHKPSQATASCKEFSCYEESFVFRLTERVQ